MGTDAGLEQIKPGMARHYKEYQRESEYRREHR